MIEEMKAFLQQLISRETLDTVLVYLDKAKEVITYLIAQLTEIRDWLFGFFVR